VYQSLVPSSVTHEYQPMALKLLNLLQGISVIVRHAVTWVSGETKYTGLSNKFQSRLKISLWSIKFSFQHGPTQRNPKWCVSKVRFSRCWPYEVVRKDQTVDPTPSNGHSDTLVNSSLTVYPIHTHWCNLRLALRWMCDPPRTGTGCARRTTPIYMWREQAIIELSRRVIFIVACCHSVKLCSPVVRAFRLQQYYEVDWQHTPLSEYNIYCERVI